MNEMIAGYRRTTRGPGLGSAVLIALTACSGGTGDLPEITVDTLSSGRVVVTNPDGVLDLPADEWSLEEVVRVGAVDGAPEELFGRITDVELGPDGLIYVLDAQASNVRVFDDTGRFVRSIGAPGSGPGELRSPYSIRIDAEGTLWIAEEGNRRYSRFTLEGESIGTLSAPIRGGLGRGQLRISNDRLWDMALVVVRRPRADGATALEALGTGVMSYSISDGLASGDTVLLGVWMPSGFEVQMGNERGVLVPPFAPYRVQEVGPHGRVWVGAGDAYEFHHVRASGDTALTVVRRTESFPLSETASEELADWVREMRDQGIRGDESVLPTRYPYFSRIIVADDGAVWVFRDAPEGESHFEVFDPSGRYLGAVQTDLRAGIIGVHPRITSDYVLGVVEDQMGVHSVALYRIVK
jgi:hypothetical protein